MVRARSISGGSDVSIGETLVCAGGGSGGMGGVGGCPPLEGWSFLMVLTKKNSFAKKNRRRAKWYGSSIRYSMLVGAGNNDKNSGGRWITERMG